MPKPSQNTSWHAVAPWYNKIVGTEGHYYHEHTVMPGALRLLDLKPEDSLVDLGCGQGVLARNIQPISRYLGIDSAPALIAEAKKYNTEDSYTFEVKDISRPIPTAKPEFTHAAFILSLQNISDAQTAIQNAAQYLQKDGKLLLVLNHPSFRIPRQSGWGVDEKTKQQYRWINRYASPLKIPISMNPGKNNSNVTWSFHHSLQDYSQMLTKSGFVITTIDEWTSDKESEGKAAKMENRARSEFPLFLCLVAKKTQ
jgi:ubiquinone/menaquinone biosynthesis C-methylase UbiE